MDGGTAEPSGRRHRAAPACRSGSRSRVLLARGRFWGKSLLDTVVSAADHAAGRDRLSAADPVRAARPIGEFLDQPSASCSLPLDRRGAGLARSWAFPDGARHAPVDQAVDERLERRRHPGRPPALMFATITLPPLPAGRDRRGAILSLPSRWASSAPPSPSSPTSWRDPDAAVGDLHSYQCRRRCRRAAFTAISIAISMSPCLGSEAARRRIGARHEVHMSLDSTSITPGSFALATLHRPAA